MFHRFFYCVFLAVLFAGCGSSSNSFEAIGGEQGGQLSLAPTIQGRVKIGGEAVPGAEVQLRRNGQVLSTATGDEGGQFRFDVVPISSQFPTVGQTAALPADLVAIVDGAEYAAVIPNGASFVYITEVSTLIHGYLESHPGATLEAAQSAVGVALGCPSEDAVDTLSDIDIFDPARFQQMAKDNGGAAGYLDSVVAGLDGGNYDFGSDPYDDLDYGHDPHHRVLRAGGHQIQALAISVLGGTAKGLALGAIGEVGARAFGWVIGSLTSNTDPSLDDVVDMLTTLQSSVDTLRVDLASRFERSDWNSAMTPLIARTVTLRSYVGTLQTIVEARGRDNVDQPAPALPFVDGFLRDFTFETSEAIIRDFFNSMLADPQSAGDTLQGLHRLQMATLGRNTPDRTHSSYDLRYNVHTRVFLNNLRFHLSQVEIATEMLANAAHSSFLDTSRPGNSLPTAILRARTIVSRGGPEDPDVSNQFQRAKQIVPDLLPRDDVIVLPHAEREFTPVVPGTPSLLYRGLWTTELRHPNEGRDLNAPRSAFLQASIRGDSTWTDLDNWQMPTLEQYQQLDRIATAAGAGDARQGLVNLGMYPASDRRQPPGMTIRGGHHRMTSITRSRVGLRTVRQVPVVEMDVWIMSRPGRAGHVYRLRYNAEDHGPPFIGSMFVRGSLSGNTPRQHQTIFATGTTARPTINVRFENRNSEYRLLASASYRFPSGQQFDLDVTNRVAWQSNLPGLVEVSNLDDRELPYGSLTYTRGGRARITASLLVDTSRPRAAAGYVEGGINCDAPNGMPVHNVMITPRNQIFTSIGDPVAYFYCTGFSRQIFPPNRDTHVATDFTNNTRLAWRLLGPDGNIVDRARAEISSASRDPLNPVALGGILRVHDRTLPNGIYRVQATLSGTSVEQIAPTVVDETRILLQLR